MLRTLFFGQPCVSLSSSFQRSFFSVLDQPKSRKYPKAFKGRVKLHAKNTTLNFGKFGLQAMETGRITAKQIDATRKAMAPLVKKGGQVWIRIFPDIPVTKKPAEVRMGKGKGNVELYVARVPVGTIMYEIEMTDDTNAKEALRQAAFRLPLRTRIISRLPGITVFNMSISQSSMRKSQIAKKAGAYPLEEIARYIVEGCSESPEDIRKLDVMVNNCSEINDVTLIASDITKRNIGLYYSTDSKKYTIKNGGVAATIVHYAACLGRTDILEKVIKPENLDMYTVVLDNENNPVAPFDVAKKNGFYTFSDKSTVRTSAGGCTLA